MPGTIDITAKENKLWMTDFGDAEAHVTFHFDAETYVLLMYKRLILEPLFSAGRLSAHGDRALISDFDRWLAAA